MSQHVVQRVLGREQLSQLREWLEQASWIDGAATAGVEAARIKRNFQLELGSPLHAQCSELVKRAFNASETFKQLTLPRRVSSLLFSRYDVGMEYGSHTDDAYRSHELLRTDIAVSLFLSDPASYEGGALIVDGDALRPAAGDAVIYPANTIHRVSAVTHGVRLAAVFWLQSLVRDEGQRDILFSLQSVINHLTNQALALTLARVHQNLQRMWIEP